MSNTSKFWVGAVIVGAVAAGVVIANRNRVDVTPTVPVAAVEPAAPAPPVLVRHALPMPKRTAEPAPTLVMSTDLAGVAKPLLQPGTDLTMASEGFSSRESFLATAYAAKNLSIPFVLLKDRVVAAKTPLEAAIRQIKPDADAKAEATRATSEARTEIARLIGS
jgi:hypothetical protein